MNKITLSKGNSRYTFSQNRYLYCVDKEQTVDNITTSITFAVTKEFGNKLFSQLKANGYSRVN